MNQWLQELAIEAGGVAMRHFKAPHRVHRKKDGSPVTMADLEIDQLLHKRITEQDPRACVLSEESADPDWREDAARVWIVDPLDGTGHFVKGSPDFGTLIALWEGGTVVEGIARFPALSITVYAKAGRGCYVNGRRARVSDRDTGEAKVVCNDPALRELHTSPWPFGYPAMQLVHVLSGMLDACVVHCGAGCGEHDYAWASVALAEAGGRLTDGHGESLQFNKPERVMPELVVASNGRAHEALIERTRLLGHPQIRI